MTLAWGAYCKDEQEATVWPVLVVQVDNGTAKQLTKTNLADALTVIESAIGRRLNEGEVAHAMHDTGDMDVGGRTRAQGRCVAHRCGQEHRRGVLQDQSVHRVGLPARRSDDVVPPRRGSHLHRPTAGPNGAHAAGTDASSAMHALNDVHLFLPYFDTQAVTSVVESLHNVEDVPPSETGSSRNLVVLGAAPGWKTCLRGAGRA
jgi:type III restriction enzyme